MSASEGVQATVLLSVLILDWILDIVMRVMKPWCVRPSGFLYCTAATHTGHHVKLERG